MRSEVRFVILLGLVTIVSAGLVPNLPFTLPWTKRPVSCDSQGECLQLYADSFSDTYGTSEPIPIKIAFEAHNGYTKIRHESIFLVRTDEFSLIEVPAVCLSNYSYLPDPDVNITMMVSRTNSSIFKWTGNRTHSGQTYRMAVSFFTFIIDLKNGAVNGIAQQRSEGNCDRENLVYDNCAEVFDAANCKPLRVCHTVSTSVVFSNVYWQIYIAFTGTDSHRLFMTSSGKIPTHFRFLSFSDLYGTLDSFDPPPAP